MYISNYKILKMEKSYKEKGYGQLIKTAWD